MVWVQGFLKRFEAFGDIEESRRVLRAKRRVELNDPAARRLVLPHTPRLIL